MSCLKTVWKKVKTAQIQIAISRGLTGIFACGFLHYDPGNNAFKAAVKKQEYGSLSVELSANFLYINWFGTYLLCILYHNLCCSDNVLFNNESILK